MSGSGKRARALGRGLDALLPPAARAAGLRRRGRLRAATPEAFYATIEELHPQPRRSRARASTTSALDELARVDQARSACSSRSWCASARSGGFEIVAGERRWRAAQRAGLHEVPVFVRELTEGQAFEAALVENLQREDLNPIETARAYQRLIDEHGTRRSRSPS